MKNTVLEWDEYTQSRMFMLHQVPWFLRGFIYFTLVLVLSVVAFILWGEMEESITARGLIRPPANVSLVRSGTSGKIESILIRTGQMVKEGDLLLTMERTILESADLTVHRQFMEMERTLQGWKDLAKRLAGDVYSENPPIDPEFASRWANYQMELQRLTIQKEQADRAYQGEKSLPLEMTSSSRMKELGEALNLAQISLLQYRESFYSTVQGEVQKGELNLLSLRTQTAQARQTLELTHVKAPVSGVVWETGKFNSGEVLGAGQEICRIVPFDSTGLKAELQVLAREAGKMEAGMPIRFRFPAFPYTEFGTLVAPITTISPDSSVSGQGEPFFLITADLPATKISDRKGRQYDLKPGLPTEAWIILRKRPIWSFLLEKMGFL